MASATPCCVKIAYACGIDWGEMLRDALGRAAPSPTEPIPTHDAASQLLTIQLNQGQPVRIEGGGVIVGGTVTTRYPDRVRYGTASESFGFARMEAGKTAAGRRQAAPRSRHH